MARVFVAAETDPVIGRGLTRLMNLLVTPAELVADAEFSGRVAEILADPTPTRCRADRTIARRAAGRRRPAP